MYWSPSVTLYTVTLIDSTTVLISWSPPFTLEGVPCYKVTLTRMRQSWQRTLPCMLYSIDHYCGILHGLAVAQFQNSGSNQCISVFTVISFTEDFMVCIKSSVTTSRNCLFALGLYVNCGNLKQHNLCMSETLHP